MRLSSTFTKLSSGEIKTREINQLIEFAVKTSKGVLLSKYRHKISKGINTNNELNDIAIDAVVPLFVTNGNGDEISLLRSLRNWKNPVKTESDAQYFFFKIICSRVEQTVTLILKDRDPIFSKIFTTLNTCISNNNFKKLNFLTTVYIVDSKVESLCTPLIQEEEFMLLDSKLFNAKQFKLINGLLEYIEQENIYFPAIPFNLLVKRIKQLNYNYFSKSEVYTPKHFSQLPFIDQVVDQELEHLKKILEVKYYSLNKLSVSEYCAMVNAFEDIAVDMKNGGIKGGLFSYFEAHYKNISNTEFYSNYHGIMNYLYSNFKIKILKKIESD